jgi:endonuclease/exonuclease/phosphatase family metal-dependent hydrolase
LAILTSANLTAAIAAEPAWRQTSTLDAEEARQAVAVDEHRVYAITNDRIARYDRATGRRTGVSTGDAKHLNSGFLADGRLYCAHSNYPGTPEISQLMALDLDTLRLETFHDFADYGGSLTWAVKHDGNWWCNFARYGNANAETFLVRFDDRWHEIGRWTYPAEVIRQLGKHSISGGVWRDGLLLCTDHDNERLYRLRLPKGGKLLELVDVQPAPFAGQGIAHDPVTGGLVGIRRAQRQVVFASLGDPRDASNQSPAKKPLRLTILSYNIHHGEGGDGRLDLARIADVIRAADPDLVALQEVDRNTARTGKVDQPAELARLTDRHFAFGANIPYQGGEYGNAVLSRWPIARTENHRLPSYDRGEQRGVLEVEVRPLESEQAVVLLCTHLDARRGDSERIASAKAINELTIKRGEQPMILAGDLNDTTSSATLAELATAWKNASGKVTPTSPAKAPLRQIDFVLTLARHSWKIVEVRVLDEAVASDHRPILATVEFSPLREGEAPAEP